MKPHSTFVLELLLRYHHPEMFGELPTETLSQNEVDYLCSVGLGPIAHATYGQWLKTCGRDQYETCQSADLTTRVIYAQLSNATVELVSELKESGIRPVLLKGITASDEYYDRPYFRVMGDVDFLVKEAEIVGVKAAMARLGYIIDDRREENLNRARHHHLPAVRHPETGVVLEAHTGLFRPGSLPSVQPIFLPEMVWEQTRPSNYQGQPVSRFSPEFQFVYSIAHWAFDSKWAVNLLSIVDIVRILEQHGESMDWSLIADWMRANDWLAGCVTVLLTYLHATGLVSLPQGIESVIRRIETELGRTNLKLFHWLIAVFPFSGRDRAGPLRAEWSAQVFWEAFLIPTRRQLRIPNASFRTFFSKQNRWNPIRIYHRAMELKAETATENS